MLGRTPVLGTWLFLGQDRRPVFTSGGKEGPDLMDSERDTVSGNGRTQEGILQRSVVHVVCGCSGQRQCLQEEF